MNSVSLAVVTLVLGIDVGWQPLDEGGLEYIIQIEPQLLGTLQDGQDIVTDIPPDVRGVRTCRVTVGTSRLPRQGNAAGSPVDTTAARPPYDSGPTTRDGVLNLPPPPSVADENAWRPAPEYSGVLNLPPPPADNFVPGAAARGAAAAPQPIPGARSVAPPARSAAPPSSEVFNPRSLATPNPRTRVNPPPVNPPSNLLAPEVPAPAHQPPAAAAPVAQPMAPPYVPEPQYVPEAEPQPAPRNYERAYQLDVLSARLPNGAEFAREEGPALGPTPAVASSPSRAASPDVDSSSSAETASRMTAAATGDDGAALDAKPWGWLMLAMMGLFVSLGLNFFLGWITWGFRQRYDAVLDQLHSARARTT